jgi:peptide/nickel transport system substrate-binding protein
MREFDRQRDKRFAILSRRDAIGGAAALALGLAAPEAPAAETTKKGGVLRLGLAGGGASDSLDPLSYADSVMIVVGRGLYSGLVELTPEGAAKPELALTFEPKDGAKTWIFNLRKGVKFSSGQEFVSEDAIYSLNRHRSGKSFASRDLRSITEIKKLDKYQLQISLEAPDADFPYILTDPRLMMTPDGFKDGPKPVGTGAYLLDKFEPGVRITLKRAPDYWRAGEGRGNFDAAEITVLTEHSERINALVAGQVDVINRVDPRTVTLLQKTPKIETLSAPSGWRPVFAMATDKPPFDSQDFRLALKYAIDRDQMLRTLYSGFGAIGNDHPIPPNDPFFNKELPQRKHDADRAAFYLKRSGLTDSSILLETSEAAFPRAPEAAALFQASAKQAGFKLDVKSEPTEGFWEKIWLKSPFLATYWSGRPAATHMLAIAFGAGSPLNDTHWRDDSFEKLLADAKGETDDAKRKPYIWEMQALLHDEGGAIVPLFRNWIDARRDTIAGYAAKGSSELANGYILEKAFLKA